MITLHTVHNIPLIFPKVNLYELVASASNGGQELMSWKKLQQVLPAHGAGESGIFAKPWEDSGWGGR